MSESNNTLPLDTGLPLEVLTTGQSVLRHKRGQTLFSQGDPADAIFYLKEGKIKIIVVSEHGKGAVIAAPSRGEFFGEGCLNGQSQRISSAIAMTDCEIVRIEKATMIRALHEDKAFSQLFISHLLKRTTRVEEDLVDQLFNSSEKRLARALLLLADFGEEGQSEAVVTKVSQETLAEMIGTTRSRVSFFMNKFRKLGFIDYNSHLKINASLMNVVLQEPKHTRSDDD